MANAAEVTTITVSKQLAEMAERTKGWTKPFVPEDIAIEAIRLFTGTKVISVRQNTLGSRAYDYDYDQFEPSRGNFTVTIDWYMICRMIEKGEVLVAE